MDGLIRLGQQDSGFNYAFSYEPEPYGYSISINTDLREDFNSLISTTGDMENLLDLDIELSEREGDEESAKFFKKAKGNTKKLLKAAQYVYFDFDMKEIVDYVQKNPALKSKKVIVTDILELNSEVISTVKSLFGEDTSYIYFNVVGNDSAISFQEYVDFINCIDNMVLEVERFDLSPLEKIMYVYDMVRNRVYQREDENESMTVSRNLSSALLGDKIVCLGYARIFMILLEKLGIKSNLSILDDVKDSVEGHVRNEIYVQDEKYGVNGVYYFDSTWDSRKRGDDNYYLLSYKYFALTKSQMDNIDNGRLISTNFPCFSEDFVEVFEEQVSKGGIFSLSDSMIDSINHMSKIIDHTRIIDKVYLKFLKLATITANEISERLNLLVPYFNRPLSAETLLQVLFNVRKIQYYSDPIKYPFGRDEFYNTVLLSKWKFKGTEEENLFLALFDYDAEEERKIKATQMRRYLQSTELDKSIQQVRVTKMLRKVLESKSETKVR